MIEAKQFVESAQRWGFDFWSGVPCSFLTPFINFTIADTQLTYISAANEGDAVAAATGAALGGRRSVVMMQNSGLGNAVSPLTSLNQVFHVPVLLIVTLRGEPGQADEPQHRLMGQITQQLLEDMQIPWQWFPDSKTQVEGVLETAVAHMDNTATPYALIMKKGMVAPYPLPEFTQFQHPSNSRMTAGLQADAGLPSRHEVLQELLDHAAVADTVLIASTGFNGRELYAVNDRPNQLYMVGSMGCAVSMGLGLAIARTDKKVIVIDGDGAALMRLGNMATVGAYAGDNYFHLLLDNHAHESTGGQATVSAAVDFPGLAMACGYNRVYRASGIQDVGGFLKARAPAFMHIRTRRGVADGLPRPSVKPATVARRLMRHLGESPRWANFAKFSS